MARITLTPGRLYTLLSAEYKKVRPPRCMSCRTPYPYLVVRSEGMPANWFVAGMSDCRHGCHTVIAEIVARLWEGYDLQDHTATAKEFPDDKMRRRRDPVWNTLNPQNGKSESR
jgi:hypothetical protein